MLYSINIDIKCVDPLSASPKGIRIATWKEKLANLLPTTSMALDVSEDLPPGADTKWIHWKCFNHLRTGVRRSWVTLVSLVMLTTMT